MTGDKVVTAGASWARDWTVIGTRRNLIGMRGMK